MPVIERLRLPPEFPALGTAGSSDAIPAQSLFTSLGQAFASDGRDGSWQLKSHIL